MIEYLLTPSAITISFWLTVIWGCAGIVKGLYAYRESNKYISLLFKKD